MSRAEPLTDADRGPWLVRVRRAAVETVEGNTRGGLPGVVVACSALKASYRAVLRGERPNLDPETCLRGGVRGEAVASAVGGEKSDRGLATAEEEARRTEKDKLATGVTLTGRAPPPRTFFVHLVGARSVLAERLMGREGHFMKAEMLRSQLETLENPGWTGEEGVVEVRIEGSIKEQVGAALEWLGERVLPDM